MATDFIECQTCAALTVPELADFHQAWHKTLTNLPQSKPTQQEPLYTNVDHVELIDKDGRCVAKVPFSHTKAIYSGDTISFPPFTIDI